MDKLFIAGLSLSTVGAVLSISGLVAGSYNAKVGLQKKVPSAVYSLDQTGKSYDFNHDGHPDLLVMNELGNYPLFGQKDGLYLTAEGMKKLPASSSYASKGSIDDAVIAAQNTKR